MTAGTEGVAYLFRLSLVGGEVVKEVLSCRLSRQRQFLSFFFFSSGLCQNCKALYYNHLPLNLHHLAPKHASHECKGEPIKKTWLYLTEHFIESLDPSIAVSIPLHCSCIEQLLSKTKNTSAKILQGCLKVTAVSCLWFLQTSASREKESYYGVNKSAAWLPFCFFL